MMTRIAILVVAQALAVSRETFPASRQAAEAEGLLDEIRAAVARIGS